MNTLQNMFNGQPNANMQHQNIIMQLMSMNEEKRAEKIAEILNQNVDSPFYNVIKYPGAPRGKGKLDLSTVVNALKAHVDHGGKFEECNISNLMLQANILQNARLC